MRHITILLMLTLVGSAVRAGKIDGNAPDFAGKKAKLVAYNDLFTSRYITLEETDIDQNGNFSFSRLPAETQPLVIVIDQARTSFFCDPTSRYKLKFTKPDSITRLPFRSSVWLIPEFELQDLDSINFSIKAINDFTDDFLQRHYMAFLKGQAKSAVKTYAAEMRARFGHNKHPFVSQHITYTIAAQETNARFSRKDIYNLYLSNAPFAVKSPAFVEFFQAFYDDWFNSYLLSEQNGDLKTAIDQNRSLWGVNAILERNDYLKRSEFRETVLMRELFKYASTKGTFDQGACVQLLQELTSNISDPVRAQMARYYYQKLVKLAVGNPAPQFELLNFEGIKHALSDYKGKYVYLDFWASWCGPCIRSMKVLKEVAPRYKDKVVFISISMDSRKRDAEKFYRKSGYDWLFLYAGVDHPIKEEYEVMMLPTYFLIGPDGKFVQSPALRPESGLSNILDKLLGINTSEKIEIWDWNKKMPGQKSGVER
jgi:thiol-disulfide isomerase/thioredoxin